MLELTDVSSFLDDTAFHARDSSLEDLTNML